jgi:hypothetical protein
MTEATLRESSPRSNGTMRQMNVADAPAVGRLFRKVFRGVDADAGGELIAFHREFAFGSPSYESESGSLVFETPDGSISSALLTVPMRFVTCERVVTGRLLCAYMADSGRAPNGAGVLSLAMRARQQNFAFSDTASPLSMNHFRSWGGVSVPLQNLGWVRAFRPIAVTVDRMVSRIFRGRGRGLARLARPLDNLLRTCLPSIAAPAAPTLRVVAMTFESFLDQAPGFVARYPVRPLWSREELRWLLEMAQRNQTLGSLSIMAVMERSDQVIGCFVFYDGGGRIARVLNVLSSKQREAEVLCAMFNAFDRLGFAEARGRAQPSLMEGLVSQAMLTFRHEAFVCVVSRHADVLDAVRKGDFYLGGLAGEGWSRLMSDFP